MRVRNILTALLVILSFLAGKFWPLVATWLDYALEWWRHFNAVDIWNQREDWATKHAFESSLFSLLPPFLIYLASVVYRKYRRFVLAYFGAASALDTLFRDQTTVHIVSSSISGATFPSAGRHVQNLTMPENVDLIPFGDAISIQLIADYFQQNYRGKKVVKIWPSGSFDIPSDQNLIAVGGPYVNSVTKHYIETIGVENFYIDEHTVGHLGGNHFEAKTDEKNKIVKDYGFAFCLRARNAEHQRVLLLFGLWPQGTRAAAEAAVGLTAPSPKRTLFRRYVAQKRDVVAILSSEGTGAAVFQTAFYGVQEIALKIL